MGHGGSQIVAGLTDNLTRQLREDSMMIGSGPPRLSCTSNGALRGQFLPLRHAFAHVILDSLRTTKAVRRLRTAFFRRASQLFFRASEEAILELSNVRGAAPSKMNPEVLHTAGGEAAQCICIPANALFFR